MPPTPTTHTQLGLFDPVLPGQHGGALSSLAAIMSAVAGTDALRAVAIGAAADCRGLGGNRGAGEDFERSFAARLDGPAQEAVSAQTLARLAPDATPALQRLAGVRWVHVAGGRAPADFTVTMAFERGGMLDVPVNLKRTGTSAAGADGVGDAVALRTLMRVALGQPASSNAAVNVPRLALRWWAGREKIRSSDYYLLVVGGDRAAGTVTTIHAQGLLSAVRADGTLATSRHPSREVALYRPAGGLLAADLDVNAAFAAAVSPAANPDDLRLALLTWLAAQRGWSPATVRRRARTLDDATDADLVHAMGAALRSLPARRTAARTVQGSTPDPDLSRSDP